MSWYYPVNIVGREVWRLTRAHDLFLSSKNCKDNKVVLNYVKFLFFFGYIAKICVLQALVPILAIALLKSPFVFLALERIGKLKKSKKLLTCTGANQISQTLSALIFEHTFV